MEVLPVHQIMAFPRVCGGDPGEKGWWKGQLWLFPACAGVILYPRPEGGGKQSFPRVCGGDPKDKHQYNVTDILFPACAGVIPVRYFVHMDDPAFPRVCGGDPIRRHLDQSNLHFSPRVRG